MAIVLDATVSGTNSNSYLTIARSNVLAEQLPHLKDWLTETDVNKAQLLVRATWLIDLYFYPTGARAVEAQARLWPRVHVVDIRKGTLLSSVAIPDFVEWATIEWAGELYRNPDMWDDVGYGLRRLETPSYRMEFDGQPSRLIPRVVQTLLAAYSMAVASPFHRVVRM